jgi:putative PIN family toxin of toxin-antitoxin system
MLRVILDTNIIISALHKPDSDADIILNLALDEESGLLQLCLSKVIFTEYQEVLSRNKFKYFDRVKTQAMLAAIRQVSLWVSPKVNVDLIKADPEDNKFLECALEARADFIITGNTRHFPFKKFETTRIVTPRKFTEFEIVRLFFAQE